MDCSSVLRLELVVRLRRQEAERLVSPPDWPVAPESSTLPTARLSSIILVMREMGYGRTPIARAPRFDLDDPVVLRNPYPTYCILRAAGPLCRGGPAQLVVTRYREVAALLRDSSLRSRIPEEYHHHNIGRGSAHAFFQSIIVYRDPPEHTRLRRLTGQALHASLVHRMENRIRALVDELLDPIVDGRTFDAVQDLAFPLPIMVVCELLGMPSSDRDQIRPRAFDLGKGFAINVSEKDRTIANAAVDWLRDYVGALLTERRRTPRPDLLTEMLLATEAGEHLTDEEILDHAAFLLFAGFETTMNVIATGCALLLEHPDQLARLRGDRSLFSTAVDEVLRFDAPIQARARFVTNPVMVGDRVVRAGRVLLLLIGSANHDERQCPDPERFDVGRSPNQHLSFGGGIHYCLGAALAHAEARIVFEQLIARFDGLEPAGAPTRHLDGGFRGYATVPVAGRAH
jgi:cytochrome P450